MDQKANNKNDVPQSHTNDTPEQDVSSTDLPENSKSVDSQPEIINTGKNVDQIAAPQVQSQEQYNSATTDVSQAQSSAPDALKDSEVLHISEKNNKSAEDPVPQNKSTKAGLSASVPSEIEKFKSTSNLVEPDSAMADNSQNAHSPSTNEEIAVLAEKTGSLDINPSADLPAEHQDPYSNSSPPGVSLSKQPSKSKVHNAIQDLLSQFDPLKEANAKKSMESLSVKSEFWVDKDGFSYNRFLEQLRKPAAKPIAKHIKMFLVDFERKKLPLSVQIKSIQDFYSFILEKMFVNEIWSNPTEKESDNTKEGIEKLITTRLYHTIFSPRSTDDSAKDRVLREKMNLFRWLKESHLDIPESARNSSFIQFAKAELVKINEFKSPRDKLICILNCCTVIFGLLKHLEGDVGADSFLPLLIYVIVVTNPPRLVSNINYISRFRAPEKLLSEAGYYLTNVMGAISFIESMDASCLSISQEDFDRHIELSIWEIESENRVKAKSRSANNATNSSNQSPSRGYWSSILDKEAADKATWLLERGSTLAKTTFEKTNQFVENLFSDFSETSAKTRGSQPPLPPRLNEGQSQTQNQSQRDLLDLNRVAEDSDQWNQTLALVCDMFPDFDKEVLEMVLQANNGYVPQTIEQLLEMSLSETADFVGITQNQVPELPVKSSTTVATATGAITGTGAGAKTDENLSDTPAKKPSQLIDFGKGINKENQHLITTPVSGTSIKNNTNNEKEDPEIGHLSDYNEDWKGRWADDSSGEEDSDGDQFDNDSFTPDNVLNQPSFPLGETKILETNPDLPSNQGSNSGSQKTDTDSPLPPRIPETSKAQPETGHHADITKNPTASSSKAQEPFIIDEEPIKLPDTSKDEELARKLQEEENKQR